MSGLDAQLDKLGNTLRWRMREYDMMLRALKLVVDTAVFDEATHRASIEEHVFGAVRACVRDVESGA